MWHSCRAWVSAAAFLAALTSSTPSLRVHAGGSEPLCSVAPGGYAAAKQSHPEAAFALAELEKHGIATWYTDRVSAAESAATAQALVSQCPSSSRLSIVVYGMPNKDCEARESMGGSNNQNNAQYAAFISELQQVVGSRNALYVLEPDAIGLLAGGGCAQTYGYDVNLAQAIATLSQNANADIYLDVGHWMLASESQLSQVTSVVNGLLTAGRVKGISINTSNYRSNAELSGLCGKFRDAMRALSGQDLKCIVDTSRNNNGPSAQDEWCNYKHAGIGHVPTGSTGDPNIDYYVWLKPPGDSDGICASGHSSDTMVGPGAGQFFPEFFKTLWNSGALVEQLGMPVIDGTVREYTEATSDSAPTPTDSTSTPTPTPTDSAKDSDASEEALTLVGTSASANATDGSANTNATATANDANTNTRTTEDGAGGSVAGQVIAPLMEDNATFTNEDKASSKAHAAPTTEAQTKSSGAGAMSTGVIVLIALVGAACVALAAVVGLRVRQRRLNEVKSPLEPRIHYLSNSPNSVARL